VTPTLSDDVPPKLIVLLDVEKLGPEVGEVMAMVGAIVSGAYVSAIVALACAATVLRAVTVTRVEPVGNTSPLIVQLAVPVANPLAPWSVAQLTWVMPALSNAVPLKLTVLFDVVKVGLEVGDVIATVVPACTSGGNGHSADGVPARTAASLKQERFAPIPMPKYGEEACRVSSSAFSLMSASVAAICVA